MIGILDYSIFFFLLILLSFFLSIIYSIWLPNRIIFGNIRYYGKSFDLDERELITIILYFFLSLYLGLFPNELINIISNEVNIFILLDY